MVVSRPTVILSKFSADLALWSAFCFRYQWCYCGWRSSKNYIRVASMYGGNIH